MFHFQVPRWEANPQMNCDYPIKLNMLRRRFWTQSSILGKTRNTILRLFFGPSRFDPKENPSFGLPRKSTFGRLPMAASFLEFSLTPNYQAQKNWKPAMHGSAAWVKLAVSCICILATGWPTAKFMKYAGRTVREFSDPSSMSLFLNNLVHLTKEEISTSVSRSYHKAIRVYHADFLENSPRIRLSGCSAGYIRLRLWVQISPDIRYYPADSPDIRTNFGAGYHDFFTFRCRSGIRSRISGAGS